MATTNLLQWNPTLANQETDAQYLADSQRAGGASDPSLFDATLANKAFYQWSTFLTALFTAFANKGYTTSDSNLSTLTAQCANFFTTADVPANVTLVPYAASVTLNATSSNGFYLESMTGNLTITGFTGLAGGQIVAMYYQQDGTGGRMIAFPSVMVGASQPDPTANAVSLQLFGYDAVTSKLRAFTPLLSAVGAFFPAALTTLGLVTAQSLTLAGGASAGQVLAWNTSSSTFTPQTAPGWSSGSTSSGYWVKDPSGRIHQWGTVSRATVTVTFPTPFTNLSSIVVVAGQTNPYGGAPNYAASITTTTFVFGNGDGGSDSGAWMADGY